MVVRLLNDTEIAKAKRDFELKKAAYDVEVQTKVTFVISNIFLMKVSNIFPFDLQTKTGDLSVFPTQKTEEMLSSV